MTRSHLSRPPGLCGTRRLLPFFVTCVVPCTLTLVLNPKAFPDSFVRGDTNADSKVDIADPVGLLGHLFIGSRRPSCDDAADANDDGALAISDAVRVLRFLFQGKEPPAAPFPAAGADPTQDALDCTGPSSDEDELFIDDELSSDRTEGIIEEYSSFEGFGRDLAETFPATLSDDIVLVSPEAYEALNELPVGESIYSLQESGVDITPVIEWLGRDTTPGPEAQQELETSVLVPVRDGGCWVVDPRIVHGSSAESPSGRHGFIRGDVNGDKRVNSADLKAFEECLGAGTVPGTRHGESLCPDAWDINDDGRIDRVDYDRLLEELNKYQQLSVPADGRACGPDRTSDALPPCSAGTCIGESVSVSVSPERVCGIGTHEVTITVTDEDGNTSQAISHVTLCDQADASCPLTAVRTEDGPSNESPDSTRHAWFIDTVIGPSPREVDMVQTNFHKDGKIRDVRYEFPFRAFSPATTSILLNGPGPAHHLFTTRRNTNCRTPTGRVERIGSGFVTMHASVGCYDRSGVKRESTCASSLEFETVYSSTLEARSASGSPCFGSTGRVEALALDEVSVRVNGESVPVMAKGASVENGNQSWVTPSFQLAAQLQQGVPGASLSFGISSTTMRGESSASEVVHASATKKMPLPMTLHMRSKGITRVLAEKRTAAKARVTTDIVGLWFIAKSECPGLNTAAGAVLLGGSDAIAAAKRSALTFLQNRLR